MKIAKVIILILISVAIIYGVYFIYVLNTPLSEVSSEKIFTIEPKWGSVVVSQELKKQGHIRDWVVFELYIWQQGKSSLLQPGQYSLNSNYSIKKVVQVLTQKLKNEKYEEVTLTFIEGWSNKDYAEYLTKQGFGEESDFFEIIQKKQSWWDNYDFLSSRPRNLDLEGYLFPDTYRVYKTATIRSIVEKMLDNFGKKITPDLLAEIKKQGKTIHEILTLASIIEKEVPNDDERKMVADIFYKRLKNNIGLQSDATVNYITGKGTTRPSFDDTRLDNPYNTYKYRGLPPGPICNPSLSSILAAIYPTANKYYYFLTTPEGKVIYSETYNQHLAAKAKYY